MQLIHRNPWELMAGLSREANRLLQDDVERAFVPAVDIHEEQQRYLVLIDLPGVNAADIELTVDGDLLTVKGERTPQAATDGATVHRSERARGRFERSFRLPETAAGEGFQADYRDGVLSVSIPKAEAATPYRIQVTAN